MPTFLRATVVDAPLEDVWAFHSTIDGLRAVTPSWTGLSIDSVVGPDGVRNPKTLEAGTHIEMRVRPLGQLPGPGWTSEITRRDRDEHRARFRDVMIDGPFETWEHTHHFLAVEDRTVIYDRLEYGLPSPLKPLEPIMEAGFRVLFAYRHARTRSLLGGSGSD